MRKPQIIVDHTSMWKLMSIFASLLAIVALAVFTFQQRHFIVNSITGHRLEIKERPRGDLSKESQKKLQEFVDEHSTVVAVNYAQANFQDNTREYFFHYSRVKDIDDAWNTTAGQKTPLFTGSAKLNSRVVQMINGQFVCLQTKDSIPGQVHPIMNVYAPITCSVAIPPGYGNFTGWINIYLSKPLSFRQMEALENVAEEMAREIYNRDIAKFTDNEGKTNF